MPPCPGTTRLQGLGDSSCGGRRLKELWTKGKIKVSKTLQIIPIIYKARHVFVHSRSGWVGNGQPVTWIVQLLSFVQASVLPADLHDVTHGTMSRPGGLEGLALQPAQTQWQQPGLPAVWRRLRGSCRVMCSRNSIQSRLVSSQVRNYRERRNCGVCLFIWFKHVVSAMIGCQMENVGWEALKKENSPRRRVLCASVQNQQVPDLLKASRQF